MFKTMPVFFLCFAICCNSQDKAKLVQDMSNRAGKGLLQLYEIDSAYVPYLPDTNLVFTRLEELQQYFFSNYKRFDSFLKRQMTLNADPTADLTAQHYYADLMEVVYFKYLQKAPKDVRSMSLLSNFSPYSTLISMEDRIRLYNSFPEKIKNSQVGKQTWKVIQDYSFNQNIGKDLSQFKHMKVFGLKGEQLPFENIYMSGKKHTLLLFGASWCSPCRRDAKALKKWLKQIDTSKIEIVSLSVDLDELKWKRYIQEEDYPWSSYRIENSMDNPLVKGLGFTAVPRNFLLNKQAKVIAENTDVRKLLTKIDN